MENTMSKKQTPFRYDIVGSFLCPAKLKEARKQFEEGQLDAKGLKQVEDDAGYGRDGHVRHFCYVFYCRCHTYLLFVIS